MLPVTLGGEARPRTIVCIGAHCDDIEIGCGGALKTLLQQGSDVTVHWLILGSDDVRGPESKAAAERLLAGARSYRVELHGFANSYMPYNGAAIKDVFEGLKRAVTPDVIFTHYRDDWHQDHRLLSELTWNTFRNHTILEYEIPKYDADLGRPNLFVPVSRADADAKVQCLMECFPSQRTRSWFTPDTFLALMRIRGIECASPTGLAEAFYARKLTTTRII